tara:strand:- start:3972 stop:5354 length:1383 start_codon:yes stop_codon:yes gene_type:complete
MKIKDLKIDVEFFFSDQYWQLFVEFTDNEIGLLEMGSENLPRKGFLLRLGIFGFGLCRSVARHISGMVPKINVDVDRPETLILSGSDNEYKSTKFLEYDADSNVLYCGTIKTKGSAPVQAYLFGALFLPLLVIRFFISTAEQRNLYKFLSDQFLLVMGWRIVQRDIYRRRNIRTVVYSNHMSPASRSAVALAREYSDATVIYVEHTPILTYWPAVDADVYCLSGQFSLDNMMRRSVLNGKDVYLLGSPKNDAIKFRKKSSSNSHIGLCVSTVDDLEVVRNLIRNILSHDDSTKLIVRPHPAFRDFEAQLALGHPRLFIRKPIDESVQDYFCSIDRLLVNDSGIFFEGLLAGVDVLRVKMSRDSLNNYGVPQEFSSIYNESISEATAFIFSNDSVSLDRKKIQFFFGNIATKFEDNASEITSMVIDSYGEKETGMAKRNKIKTYLSESKHDGCCIYRLITQ